MKQFKVEERYKDASYWDEDAIFLHSDKHRVWHYPIFIREWMTIAEPGDCLLASFNDCILRMKCEEATNPEMNTVVSIQNLSGNCTEISQDIQELSNKIYSIR